MKCGWGNGGQKVACRVHPPPRAPAEQPAICSFRVNMYRNPGNNPSHEASPGQVISVTSQRLTELRDRI